MKGNPKVLEHLQLLLNNELMARDQYMAHANQFKDWGLDKLHERLHHEMEEETEHAEAIMERMLFLEAEPDMNAQEKANVGSDVATMFRNDLQVEYDVDKALKEAIAVCEEEQDYITRKVLTQLLDDTEMDHAYWLEQQLRLIDMVGIENYIQKQMS
ncbi:bacterioferritin [Oceanospirillum sanctuarii]|uniref:bacterioferritin n=1 Tax=Oceanospirillum sanctuarii TaxID=1434821 RepID=UPI000A383CBF|nr:bacterioferritin [Oceanospirillum sanctuarii]